MTVWGALTTSDGLALRGDAGTVPPITLGEAPNSTRCGTTTTTAVSTRWRRGGWGEAVWWGMAAYDLTTVDANFR